MGSVGFVGFGRFGAALASLCQESGFHVRAYDEGAEVPDELRAASLRELARAAELLVIAVPVPRVREVLVELRPELGPGHFVLDVGSVKTGPVAAMRELLGPAVPWIGTHPLFGPASLARGERPLRVVICPTPEHPGASARGRAFFTRLGCEVIEESVEVHDRTMALTHALTFFVAKGMIDAGVRTDVTFAPPSFQAIARTIDTVRSDAGHLFAALHRENPYAAESRKRLLDSLVAADKQLGDSDDVEPSSKALAIGDFGEPSAEVRETRELIDELDHELCELLARRAQLARRVGRAKADLGRGVHDPSREGRLLAARKAWAVSRGLDAASVEEIFEAILRFSRRLQMPSATDHETDAIDEETER
jgi:prephenate dehydrogenase